MSQEISAFGVQPVLHRQCSQLRHRRQVQLQTMNVNFYHLIVNFLSVRCSIEDRRLLLPILVYLSFRP